MSQDEIDIIEKKLEAIKQRIALNQAKQQAIKDQIQNKQSYCCKDVCNIFNTELNEIELQLMKIDILAYKRFPLYAKYFAEIEPLHNESFKDFAIRVYNTPTERTRLINFLSKSPKTKTVILQRTLLHDMLQQIKDNNICECD